MPKEATRLTPKEAKMHRRCTKNSRWSTEANRQTTVVRFPAGSSTPAQQQAAAELSNTLAATELIVNKSKAQTGKLHVLDEEGYMEKAWDLDTYQDEFPSDGGGDEDGDEGDWLNDLAGEASMDDAVKELTENNTVTNPTKPHNLPGLCHLS